MPHAQLTEKRWFIRAWRVECGGTWFDVRYCGRGIGRETVEVDGRVAARRTGFGWMSCAYRFRLDERHEILLSVAVPWWCELLPCSDLSFVQLLVNGEVLYAERDAPARSLPTVEAAPHGFDLTGP